MWSANYAISAVSMTTPSVDMTQFAENLIRTCKNLPPKLLIVFKGILLIHTRTSYFLLANILLIVLKNCQNHDTFMLI